MKMIIITKNPKSEGSFFGKPTILVKDRFNQDVCLFYTIKETTHNRFGGKNDWVVTYCMYNPKHPEYEWVQNSGALRPWIGKQVCDKRTCYVETPLYGGTTEKYFLLNKEEMLIEEFTLRSIGPQWAINLSQEWDRSFIHSWDGKYYYLLPTEEGWKSFDSMEDMLSYKEKSTDVVEDDVNPRPRRPRIK